MFCGTHEEPEIFTNIRDFATLFYVSMRRKSSEWLQTSIESDWYAIWVIRDLQCLDLAIRDFAFFKHCFYRKNMQVIKKSVLLAYFRESGKRNCYVRDS